MKKRAHIYKRASVIMLSAIIAGTTPISIFAQNNKSNNTVQEQSISEDKSTQPYIQNYDRPEGITWTHVKDNGTTAVENGFLNVTNQGDYRLIENESMSLEDGEIEFRFQASKEHTGRFGAIFRASGDNHGVVAYDANGTWTVEDNKGNYKIFKGPVLEAEDWATVRVMFIGNHITVKILDETTKEFKTYFDEVVDFMPVQEGKAGYRSWWNSKTTVVDYLKYGPIGSLDEDGQVPDISIESITPVKVSTFKRLKPELPKKVKVKYNNGATGNANVAWDYIDPSKYAEAGEFTVEGTVGGTDVKAIATVTVRGDAIIYQPDYSIPENQGWKTTKGGGQVTYEGNSVTAGMNGVSLAVDEKSPELKDFTYETEFKTTNNDGRIGLMFRYASDNDWASICYDNGGWIWKTYNNGQEQYGGFGGSSVKLEANKTYNMKIKVQDNNVSLWIDGELVGAQSIASLPNKPGKIGLHGWFGNKNVTLGNIKVEEILPLLPPEVGETEEQIIESKDMKVVLDNNFPRVIEYEWKEDGSILEGEKEQLYIMEINNEKYIPKVACSTANNKTTYTLSVEEIGVEVTLEMYVNNNKLRMEVTNIKESGDTKVKTINFPNHSLASVKSSENGKTASVVTTGDWNNIVEEFIDVKDLDESSKGKTYGFINNDEFAVTVNNNVIEGGNRVVLSTSNRDGYKQTGIGNGTWTYREELVMPEGHTPEEELPWSEVMIAKDTNEDETVDWQDAAIHYRNNMIVPNGGEDIKNQLSHIDFNIAYTQNPFLRSLDTIKKISNYTDNFGQLVLHKGYQAEGHDDSHPDYGGHIGIRQGGVEDFNTLINEGKKYNASIGVHINATEYAKDAFEVNPDLINENAPGWAWLDKTYYVDQRQDITSGELFRRLDMLKADAPDLGWVYVDVYTGNGWNAHKLAEKIHDLDYTFATEMNGPLEQDVVWTHWGGDPAYPNKGNASQIMRFIKNDTHDTFLADPLIKGNKHLLSGGWGTRHDIEGEYGMEVFYNQVLPTKYLQHFPIMKMTDNEVFFENGVRSVYEGENINYYREDRLVATTPKNSIGDTGIGDTQLFLPWNPVEEDEKIYHWNPLSTSSTWELPDSWKNLDTVQLYELDDLGRTFVKEVKVTDGKVKLDVEKDTPYLVMKGKVKEERIDDWGYGAQIKDPGFDSQTWNSWEKDSDAKDTKHIQVINENTERRVGNDLVKISGNDGADAEISQEIEGLEKGKTYSVSAWVKNDGNREIELEVEGEEVEVETNMDEVYHKRQGEGVKFINDTFTRIEVEFTADDDEADISLEIGEGAKDSEVFIDDFRIWEHPGHTNKDGYVLYEDFENVDEGIAPFYLAEGRGTSNRTHLAEKNIFGSQYKHWTLDGRFSLKSNQQPGESGEMFVTEDSTFKLEPNKTYELGFLYSLADAKPGYTFNIKSKSQGTLLSIDLGATGVSGDSLTKSKEIVQKFTTGNTDDYYISVDKKAHDGDIVQLILDNVYVKELNESIKTPVLKHVNLNTMVNEFEVGQQAEFDVDALMNNGESVGLSKAQIEYKVSNPKVLEIKDGKMIAKSKGKSNVFVKVKLDNKVITSNHITINVK